MNKHRFLLAACVFAFLLILSACTNGNGQAETPAQPTDLQAQNEIITTSPDVPSTPLQQPEETTEPEEPIILSGEVIISLDYESIPGWASNQYAVWIEDIDGNYIKTLYATAWTADGGYKTRPDSIALWVEKSNLASMTSVEVDAISGATPRAGTQSHSWDLTDADGDVVSLGEYKFFVEGTLRWKNYVLYSGVITIGDTPMTITADAEYHYETSNGQDALTSDSPENSMISNVTAAYIPAVYNQ